MIVTASSRSSESAPRPSQNGPVGADERNDRVDAARSARSCRARRSACARRRNTIASSETLRCSESTTKRGQRGVLQTPDVDDAEHDGQRQQQQRDDAGRARQVPVGAAADDREWQRSIPRLAALARADRCAGQCADRRDRAVAARLQPRRQLELGRASPAPSGRARARRWQAMFASAQLVGGHADRAPARVRWGPGRGVDDVVHRAAFVTPTPDGRARRRQAARADRDRLPGRCGVAAVVVGHVDAPAAAPVPVRPSRCRRQG